MVYVKVVLLLFIQPTNNETNIFNCPLCRRKYSTFEDGYNELEPNLLNMVFRNNKVSGASHPSNLFYLRSKTDLKLDSSGNFLFND